MPSPDFKKIALQVADAIAGRDVDDAQAAGVIEPALIAAFNAGCAAFLMERDGDDIKIRQITDFFHTAKEPTDAPR